MGGVDPLDSVEQDHFWHLIALLQENGVRRLRPAPGGSSGHPFNRSP